MADTNKTPLTFRWGNKVTGATAPEFIAGSILIAKEERAMYIDAPEGRIRLGDFRPVANLAALAAEGEWTETALYYLEEENALVRWDASANNGAGKWVVINDQSEVLEKINKNAVDITANANAITGLNTRLETAEGEIDTLQGDVQDLKDTIGSASGAGSVLERITAAEKAIDALEEEDIEINKLVSANSANITANSSAISLKADQSEVDTISGNLSTLQSEVAQNKTDAAAATKQVADDLTAYKTLNNAAVEAVEAKANKNENDITNLALADGTLQGNIDKVDAKFANYVLTETYNQKVSQLNQNIETAQDQADKGVADAAAAQKTADEAAASAAANATRIEQVSTRAEKGITDAKAAQDDVDALELKVGVGSIPADKTLVQMIQEAQSNATYDDTKVKADIAKNAGDIAANATAIEGLKTSKADKTAVEAVAGDLSTLSGTVTSNYNDLNGKVSKAQEDATKANNDLATHKQAYESKMSLLDLEDQRLQGEINKKADTSALTTLQGTVTNNYSDLNGKISANSKLISDNAAAIEDLQENNEGLGSRVTVLENSSATQAEKIGDLEGDVADLVKADEKLAADIKTISDDYLKAADKTELQGNINTVSGALTTYKTNNDSRVLAIETDITSVVKPGIKANADAIDAILNGTKLDSFADVEAEIAASFAANDAMVFKGVINKASGLPTTAQSGWTYKVAENGTYNEQPALVGDLFIYVDGVWQYVPSGNEVQDTIGIVSEKITDGAELSIVTDENISGQKVKVLSGNDSILVDGSTANQVTISMVWGTF